MSRNKRRRLEAFAAKSRAAQAATAAPAKTGRLEVEITETTITVPQFEMSNCIENGIGEGQTTATENVAEGVSAVVCMIPGQGDQPAAKKAQALVFDKATFPDEAAATAWIEANGPGAMEAIGKADKRRALADHCRWHECPLEEFAATLQDGDETDPGVDVKRASDSVDAAREQIVNAMIAKGWSDGPNAPEQLEYDFIIQEMFPDAVVCVDYLTGKYYTVGYTVDESTGAVTLGEAAETDLIFEPKESSPTAPPAPAANPTQVGPAPTGATSRGKRRARFDSTRVDRKEMLGPDDKPKTGYRMLVATSGWTADGRYIEPGAVTDAVARGLFDNIRCYWQHPTDDGDGSTTRPNLPFGYSKKGTAEAVKNVAGHVDAYVTIVLYDNTIGNDIKPILEASLDEGVAQIRNSLFFDFIGGWGEKDGRRAYIYERFDAIKAIDFLDNPAMPRTGVTGRAAAAKQPTTQATTGDLTVTERQELEMLRREKAQRAVADTVEALLKESGLPDDIKANTRIILKKADAEEATAYIANLKLTFFHDLKKPAGGDNTKTDDGAAGDKDPFADLKPEVAERFRELAKSLKLTPAQLKAAADKEAGRV